SGGKTRLIVNLNKLTSFESTVSGNTLSLRVGGVERTVYRDEVTTASAPAQGVSGSASGRALADVDFSRGGEGEGLVQVALSDPNVSVDVQQQGSKILLSFFNTTLPEALNRRLDVIDFATPVT